MAESLPNTNSSDMSDEIEVWEQESDVIDLDLSSSELSVVKVVDLDLGFSDLSEVTVVDLDLSSSDLSEVKVINLDVLRTLVR